MDSWIVVWSGSRVFSHPGARIESSCKSSEMISGSWPTDTPVASYVYGQSRITLSCIVLHRTSVGSGLFDEQYAAWHRTIIRMIEMQCWLSIPKANGSSRG